MGEWMPIYISLFIIFAVYLVLPTIILDYGDVTEVDNNNFLLTPVSNLIDDGISIFGYNFNPLNLIPTIKQYILDYINAFSYIPLKFLIPLLLIVWFGIFYSIVKLLPTT